VPTSLGSALVAELSELYDGETLELDGHSYALYEETDEINERKYVLWDRIYSRDDGKFFLQSCSKSGSYWSDYEYEYGEDAYEVVQVEVKRLEWKVKE
jgi:hypothetical protein